MDAMYVTMHFKIVLVEIRLALKLIDVSGFLVAPAPGHLF